MHSSSWTHANRVTIGDIMNAATALFAERGYDCTPLAEIAGQAGVAAGTIIYHFKRKERLLAELNLRFLRGLHSHCEKSASRGDDGLGSVLLFVTAYHEYLQTHPQDYAVYYRSLPGEKLKSSHELAPPIAAAERKLTALLQCLLVQGLNDKTINNREVTSCARSIQALLHGASVMVLFQNADAGAMSRDAVNYARLLLSTPAQPCLITD